MSEGAPDPESRAASSRVPETAVRAANGPDEAADTRRFGVRIGTLALLTPQGAPAEFMAAPALCAVPGGPPWLVGLVNQRGDVVPVFDLLRALDQPAVDSAAGAVAGALILGRGERALGLACSGLPGTARVRAVAASDPVPKSTLDGLAPEFVRRVRAVFEDLEEGPARLWLDVDLAAFFEGLKSR